MAEEARYDLKRGLILGVPQPERLRNGGQDVIVGGERREGDEDDAVGESWRRFLADAQGQARLADPTGTGQSHEPCPFGQGHEDRSHIGLATDKRGQRAGTATMGRVDNVGQWLLGPPDRERPDRRWIW
jgi:hypothetical protein